jgi:aryl-alcohol dehydrogenase-like predicted oxidoreductase
MRMKGEQIMYMQKLSRRQFIGTSVAIAGAALAGPAFASTTKRTATDRVVLGNTGIKLSRLGIGTGSNGGNTQAALGKDGFIKLVRYAYDKGITYFDTAKNYKTFDWIGDAIKDLPREKIFVLSKIGGNPEKPEEAIDHILQTYKTDYVDAMLVHCATKDTWTDDTKRLMDAIHEAQQKKKILSKGVSCHSLPALRAAAKSDWVDMNLVRVNPQAAHIDGETPKWDAVGNDINPVLEQIKTMDAKGHGIIGMKIIGNGEFTKAEDREKSIRFAMSRPEIDAVVIGCKSEAEIDEAIERINNALA